MGFWTRVRLPSGPLKAIAKAVVFFTRKGMKYMNQDKNKLGEGSVGKLLFRLALPAIVAQLVNLLYSMVDRIYIGHIPQSGDLALTGLGLCFPVLMIVTAFAQLIGGGGAPLVAIHMGRGEKEEAEKILGSGVAMLTAIALVITVVLLFATEPVLRLFGASDQTLPFAQDYLEIYIVGTIFVLFSLGLNPFITTQGFSKDAMKTVLIGAVCNIILDPVFIFGFDMGVKGAALATILSQGISAVWVVLFLTGKKSMLHIKKQYLRIDFKILLPVMALGVSPFIMSATESAINIAFNMSLSRFGGDVAVGAMTILASIMQLQMMPVQGLSQGAQPIMSYNYGAGNIDRVKKASGLLFLCCFGYTMLFWLAVQLFPEVFVRIFNDSEELLNTTVWALRIYMAVSGLFGIQMAVQQTFVSLGQAKLSLFIACLRKIILLIPLILILPLFFENKVFAVFLAEPVADFISVTTAGTLFALNIRQILAKKAKIEKEA